MYLEVRSYLSTKLQALEDKIVQKAVAKILDVVYDRNFHGFSHGFREGHSQHMALHELREQLMSVDFSTILTKSCC